MKKENKSLLFKITGGVLLFFILGLFTRFAFLENPKEVVFDEAYFFYFAVDYENSEYFFDIHPPLGKLILWANAKNFGIEEYAEKIKEEKRFQKRFAEDQKNILDEIDQLRDKNRSETDTSKQEKNQEKIEILKKKYDQLHENYLKIQAENADFKKKPIGTNYSDDINMQGVRALPALFGALLVPLVFLFVFFLTRSFLASGFSASIILFSPALLVESQYVLMDSLLIFFVISGIYFLFRFKENPSWKWWIIASILSAIAISIKWTGASTLAIAGVILFWITLKNQQWKQFFLKGFFIWGIVILAYIASFAIHFSVLSETGKGDPYHTPEFKASLEDTPESKNPEIIPMGFWKRFFELNYLMGERSASITATHPYQSTPWDWLKGDGHIFLWQKAQEPSEYEDIKNLSPREIRELKQELLQEGLSTEEIEQKINPEIVKQELFLFTNSTVWKLTSASLFTLFILSFFFLSHKGIAYWNKRQNRKRNEEQEKQSEQLLKTENTQSFSQNPSFFTCCALLPLFQFADKTVQKNYENIILLLIAASINILPFFFITRPEFLYHSFNFFVLGVIAFGMLFHLIFTHPYTKAIIAGSTACLLACFFFSKLPIIYGFEMTIKEEQRILPWHSNNSYFSSCFWNTDK
jgi:dolichyl-phosphate-mannose--protein O-mannosyl transferase